MIQAIWQAMVYTPWWVYLIFALLIRIGIQALKSRDVAPFKVYLIPVFFMGMSVHSLFFNFHLSIKLLCISVMCFLVGNFVGWLITNPKEIFYKPEVKKFHISGAPDTLVLLVFVFLTKYYFGYTMAIDPSKLQNTVFELSMLSSSMFISGIFAGRLLTVVYKSFGRQDARVNEVK